MLVYYVMQINKVLVTLCFTISNKKIKKKAEYKIVIVSDFYVLSLIKKVQNMNVY
jgi:hypothetical protein